MKDIDKEVNENEVELNEEQKKGLKNIKSISIFVVIFSLIAFLIITYFTDLIGQKFGTTGENIALGLIALLLIFAWYKNNKDNK